MIMNLGSYWQFSLNSNRRMFHTIALYSVLIIAEFTNTDFLNTEPRWNHEKSKLSPSFKCYYFSLVKMLLLLMYYYFIATHFVFYFVVIILVIYAVNRLFMQ